MSRVFFLFINIRSLEILARIRITLLFQTIRGEPGTTQTFERNESLQKNDVIISIKVCILFITEE